jgi:16S rRNA (cytidine1402-2'-O)-methyltransferase
MATVYLIPCYLNEASLDPIPQYVQTAIRACDTFFVENERTARRYIKSMMKDFVIDDHTWFTIGKAEEAVRQSFRDALTKDATIGIISEAGCPGVADPGQLLVALAHEGKAVVKPLVGPNSILLALMASGMSGQQFEFVGYLPIDNAQRATMIRQLEQTAAKKDSTQIFIETPYRNQKMLDDLLKTCNDKTRLCVAIDLTGPEEKIISQSISDWKKNRVTLGKVPAIFLLYSTH